ncbi:hypothetical protein O0L34_g13799 [Tuta absoluta]|nr:hypothetical protein O0L34_g13799 [Tuta absoluta]
MPRMQATDCLLLLTLLNLREASAWIGNEYTNEYRPSRPLPGPFKVTPLVSDPGFRWSFEGMNYDSPPHQISTNQNKKDYHTCIGEYVRCLMRDSKPAEMCALDTWTGYYYKFNTICDIERENCFFTTVTYSGKYNRQDHTMNRFLYDGEGWLAHEDTKYVIGESLWYKWYCYWGDIQFYHYGMRRSPVSSPAHPQQPA